MKAETILASLESLKKAGLFRTPKKFVDVAELWLQKFRNMSDEQFLSAISAIIDNEGNWPTVSTIHKYVSDHAKPKQGKNTCPYCEDIGFLLIKSRGIDITYACKCKKGQKVRDNSKIASYESLGIPWPEPIERATASKKMSKKNRELIDTFLERIGRKVPEGGLLGGDESLWESMTDGSLCE